jgi:hypothetical protein
LDILIYNSVKDIKYYTVNYHYYLHYKCEVAKLGTAATGKFLSGKRERERASVQCCQIKQDFRVAKKAETPSLLNL